MKVLESIKSFVLTGKRKKVITASVTGAVVVATAALFFCTTAASQKNKAQNTISQSSSSSETDGTFASASAVSVPASSGSSSKSPLSVNVGASSSKAEVSSSASVSTNTKKNLSRSTAIKTQASLKTTSIPSAIPQKGTSSTTNNRTSSTTNTNNKYANYTPLDMTDFNIGKSIYAFDVSVVTRFENPIANSSNIPKNSYGDFIVDLQGPVQLYAYGEVSIDNLRRVLINGHHYIGGGNDKYVVTGVYDNRSGITYNRSSMSTAIKQVYEKGFVNNPYKGTTSYSDGYLCTKISDGGSAAKIGYVRAVVFTLKKIS